MRFALARLLVVSGLLLSVSLPGTAQVIRSDAPWVLPRLQGAIQLDGHSDEPAWQAIEPLPLIMDYPVFEGEMTERTEIRVAYDDDYLYLAGRFYDQPGDVRTNSLYRDEMSGDDLFSIMLDTFNDNENGLWFFTTPAGTRLDWAITNDAEFSGRRPFNESWNAHWDARTVQTEDGWFAEMRLPFSTLGFQALDGQVTMGMTVYRYIASKNERHIFPPISPEWNMGFAKPSVAQDVVLTGVRSQKPLYITPYALGGLTRQSQENEAGTAYVTDNNTSYDFGLDAKYNLTNNLTLDATINTDFAQIEADDAQVNLTRFSLFFPEKRQFFQERAGLFAFRLNGQDQLFYSRRIGLNDGEALPILGGVRAVGRLGGWDLGFLDMQTARQGDVPTENFGVLRLRRRVVNENSFVGGMVTSRLNDGGTSNLAYGLDGVFRIGESDYVTARWAQTFDEAHRDTTNSAPTTGGVFTAGLERRSQAGFGYEGWLTWTGPHFDPAVGFVQRLNYTELNGRLSYGWFPEEASALRRIRANVYPSVVMRNERLSDPEAGVDLIESVFVGTPVNIQFKRGGWVFLGTQTRYESLEDSLTFANDAAVPPGGYTFTQADIGLSTGNNERLRSEFFAGAGRFYDGWTALFGVTPTWVLSRHLELSAEYHFDAVRFPDRDTGFSSHIIRFRAKGALDTRLSLSTFVQYSHLSGQVGANVRFRYNLREGNDLWLVYNEGVNTVRTRDGLAVPRLGGRALLLKYTHTFKI